MAVQITANAQALVRELARAEGAVQRSTNVMQRAVESLDRGFGKLNETGALVGEALAAIGLEEAARHLIELGEASLQAASALENQAKKIGLSAEAIQALRFQGAQAGVSIEAMDSALTHFSKSVAEAADGTGSLAEIARRYGVQMRDSVTGEIKPASDQLAVWADVVKHAGSEQERVRIVTAAFGRDAGNLTNVLSGGADALKAATKQATLFGAVISGSLITSASELGDNLDALKQGLSASFQTGLLEGLTRNAEGLEQTMSRLGPKAIEAGRAVADGFDMSIKAVAFLAEHLDALQAILVTYTGGRLGSMFGPWGTAIGLVAGALTSTLLPSLLETNSSIGEQDKAIRKLADAMDYARQHAGALADAQVELAKKGVADQITALQKQMIEISNSYGDAPSTSTRVAEQLAARLKPLQDQISRLNLGLQDNIVVTGRHVAVTLQAETAVTGYAGALNQAAPRLREQIANQEALIPALKAGQYQYEVAAEAQRLLTSNQVQSVEAAQILATKIVALGMAYKQVEYARQIKDTQELVGATLESRHAHDVLAEAIRLEATGVAKNRAEALRLAEAMVKVKTALAAAGFQEHLKELGQVVDALKQSQPEYEITAKAIDLLNQGIAATPAKAREMAEAWHKLDQAFKQTELRNQIDDTNALVAALKKGEHEYEVTDTALQLYRRGVVDSVEAGKAFAETLVDQEDHLRTLHRAMEIPLDALANTWSSLEQTFEGTIQTMLSKGKVDFKDFFGGVLDDFTSLLAKMATQALEAPIIIPMITAAAGALGFSGAQLTQVGQQFGVSNLGSGLAGGAAAGTLTGLTGAINSFGVNQLGIGAYTYAPGAVSTGAGGVTATSGTVGVSGGLASLLGVGALGALGGNLLANLTGMRNKTGATIGAGAGAMAGFELGSVVPGIGNVVGAIIGGLVGSLAGLFGAKPSDMTASYSGVATGGYPLASIGNIPGTKKFSAENDAAAKGAAQGVVDFVKQLTGAIGGRMELAGGPGFNISVGNRDGVRATFGDGQEKTFGSADELTAALVDWVIAGVRDVPDDVATAIKHIDFHGDMQAAIADLNFAKTFAATVKAMTSGVLDPQQDAYSAAAIAVQGYIAQIKQFKETTDRLGLSTDDAAAAAKGFVDQLVGIKDVATQDDFTKSIEALKGTFSAIGPLLEEVGYSADTGGDLLHQALAKIGVSREKNFARMDLSLTNPMQAELSDLEDEHQTELAHAKLTGEDITSLEKYYADKRLDILKKYGQDAVSIAQAQITEQVDQLKAVQQLAAQAVDAQMTVLENERNVISQTVAASEAAIASIRSARQKILFDANTSPLSNQQRLEMLMQQLNAAYAAYQGGDKSQAGTIADLAQQAAQANVAFNASSEAGVQVQEQILGILDNTESSTQSALTIANLQLQANQAQVDALHQMLDLLNRQVVPGSAAATTGGSLDALNSDYARAHSAALASGMTEAQFAASPVFKGFQSQVLSDVSGLTDTGRLLSDYSSLSGQTSDPIYGSNAQILSSGIGSRLHELGVPGFAAGGVTGHLAQVHSGELLYTGPSARVFNRSQSDEIMSGGRGMNAVAAGLSRLTDVVAAGCEETNEILRQHSSRLASIEGTLELAGRRR